MPEGTIDTNDYHRPGLRRVAGEAVSIARLIPHVAKAQLKTSPWLTNQQHLSHPTIVMPGVGSPGCSVDDVVAALLDSNINAQNWGNHINLGPTHRAYKRMVRDIHQMYSETGQKLTAAGHSLGALYGLYLCRVFPHLFESYVGLAGPCQLALEDAYDKTNVGAAFKVMDFFKPLYERKLMEHWAPESQLEPIDVPRTMIIAGRDGVVDPLSCELPNQPGCKNFYLDTTHGDILSDETAAELMTHVIHHGNDSRVPLHIARRLITRDDVEEFRVKDFQLRERINGVGEFIGMAAHHAARQIGGTIYAGVNAPYRLVRRSQQAVQEQHVEESIPRGFPPLSRTRLVAAPTR